MLRKFLVPVCEYRNLIGAASFISDIAAFMLKPFFLIGSTITAFAFIGTVCSVHFARYGQSLFFGSGFT